MKKVLQKRQDIAFYLKLTLVRRNPQLEEKSKSIVCSKSLKSLDDAFEGAAIPRKECQTKELEDNTKFMENNNFNGVPLIVFPDGSVQKGYLEAAMLEARIDQSAARMKAEGKQKKGDEERMK